MAGGARVSKLPWWTLARIAFLIALVAGANFAADRLVEFLEFDLRPSNEDAVHRAIMTAAVVYALLIAVPFVPGVEVGLALIGMVGPGIILLVYLSTIVGLSISYFVGRLLPLTWLTRLFEWLRFTRAANLLRTIQPLNGEERLSFIMARSPRRIIPFLLQHRYLTLAVAINLPGNIVIGGGGGLALMAGISRLYSVPGFLATIALAVSPLPLAVYVLGKAVLPV